MKFLLTIGEGALGELGTAPRYLAADAGSFALTGIDVTLTYYVPNRHRLAAIGEYAVGELPTIDTVTAYSVDAATGAFLLTGQDAILAYGHKLPAGTGAFTLTGIDATFSVTMPAGTGTFLLTGQDVSVTATRRLDATPYAIPSRYAHGLFAPLGHVALGGSSFVDATAQTTFALTGQAAFTALGHKVPAEAGAFVLTGQAANLVPARNLVANIGAFTLSGQAAPSIITMPALAGSFTLSGQAIDFALRRPRLFGRPRVGSALSGRSRIGSGINGRSRVGSGIIGKAA